MANELVTAIALLSAIVGSAFAVWWNTADKTPVSYKQLAKALSVAAFGAIMLVNITSLPATSDPNFTWIGVIISNLFIGAGLAKASNHLQTDTPPSTNPIQS